MFKAIKLPLATHSPLQGMPDSSDWSVYPHWSINELYLFEVFSHIKYLETYTNDIREMRIENLGKKKTTYVLKRILMVIKWSWKITFR